ncbi:MAG: ACT domain-containing protein [Paracoccaceae bacterium]
MRLRLRWIEGLYGIARLEADAMIPEWADGPGFVSISRADDELTVVCLAARIPGDVQADREWVCLRSVGPFAFDESGVVLRLIEPLSLAGLGVFVVCTFDGEHLLVAANDRERAENLLRATGYDFD